MRPLRKRWRLRIGDWTTCPYEDRGTVPSVTLPMTALHGGQNSGPGEVVMRRSAIQTMGFTFGMTVNVRMRRAPWCPRRRCRPRWLTMCSDTSGMYRTSDDLFDTYRNLFLAFESLLSDIRPRQRVLGFVKSFGPSDRESWPRPRNFPA